MEEKIEPFEFIDEKELDDIQTFTCNFCKNKISLMPFICNFCNNENKLKINDLYFCDIICAKLYSLTNNLSITKFDKQKYDEFYKNNLLTKSAMEYYSFLRKLDLNLFPEINLNLNNLDEFKLNYVYYLKNYLLQSLV